MHARTDTCNAKPTTTNMVEIIFGACVCIFRFRRYTVYIRSRQKSVAEAASSGSLGRSTGTSRIPLNKRKLGESSTLPHDDEDMGSTHQHRYNRLAGPAAALKIQQLRRLETGYSYPYAIPTMAGAGGSRLRCSMQAPHLPPCYNCSLPFSRFCAEHILSDPTQELYVKCTPIDGSACSNPVLRFQSPQLCSKCINLTDFMRNPRLSKKPSMTRSSLHTSNPLLDDDPSGIMGFSAGIGDELDFDGLEALVGVGDGVMSDISMGMSSADLGELTGLGLIAPLHEADKADIEAISSELAKTADFDSPTAASADPTTVMSVDETTGTVEVTAAADSSQQEKTEVTAGNGATNATTSDPRSTSVAAENTVPSTETQAGEGTA